MDGCRITGLFEADSELVTTMARGQVSDICYEVWGCPVRAEIGPTEFKEN